MWPWENEDGLINNQDKIIQKPGRKVGFESKLF